MTTLETTAVRPGVRITRAGTPDRRQTTPSPSARVDRNNEIIRRAIEGRGSVSLTDLAKEYGLTRARIQKIVGDAGISMRTMRRANKKPVKVECGICHALYVKGTYKQHVAAAGHRQLTPPGEKVQRNNEIIRLFKDEYNTSEIARYFDIPQPVVSRVLHRAGLRSEGRRPRKGGLEPGAGRGL